MKKEIVVNRANELQINEILRIESECGLGHWSIAECRREISSLDAVFLTAADGADGDDVVGFVFARLITSVVEIISIGVLQNNRQRGVGSALLSKLIEAIKPIDVSEIWLEVRESNAAAREFYLAHNFIEVGMRKNYYQKPPENAILMSLPLDQKIQKNEYFT